MHLMIDKDKILIVLFCFEVEHQLISELNIYD